MVARSLILPLVAATVCAFATSTVARAELGDDALLSAKRAVSFLTDKVSTNGGYLWRYSSDLSKREGEGIVKTETVWVQPPGTPSVGEAFVDLFVATDDPQFLGAAMDAAEALRLGQMRSGGWQASIEFSADRRKKWAYRSEALSKRSKDQSSLDDDKTQSALRFLIRLDKATGFQDETIHEMTLYGLEGLLKRGQFSGGGFPQVWMDNRLPDDDTPAIKASYPSSFPRQYPGHNEYWNRFTLNDHLARDVMSVLLLAEDVYGDSRYHDAAIKLADALLNAQLPGPQPAWAQQYDQEMHPIWARKFEPPAITSSESFSVIETLMMIYHRTGDQKYLDPIPKALDYLKSCEFSDGQVARFYELRTNRPLYFTRDYQLTYDDSDVPTHYGFKLRSKVDVLRKRFQKVSNNRSVNGPLTGAVAKKPSRKHVAQIIGLQDDRGAWTNTDSLRFYKTPGPVIDMATTVKNLKSLAEFLAQP